MRTVQDPTSATRWLPVYNTESIPVPPFAVMRTTGIEDGVYQVAQPNADSMTEVLINGPVSIPPLTKGSGHRTDPAQVLIETIDGTPAVGNDYGTEASNWKLRKNKTGFRVLGSVGDNTVEATFYGSSYKEIRDELDTISGAALVDTAVTGLVAGSDERPDATTTQVMGWGRKYFSHHMGAGQSIIAGLTPGAAEATAQTMFGMVITTFGVDTGLTDLVQCAATPDYGVVNVGAERLTDTTAAMRFRVWQPNGSLAATARLSASGFTCPGLTLSSGNVVGALDAGSDRQVTLGVASY